MAISKAFLEYFRTEFFSDDPEHFSAFENSLLRPLKKTVRVNPLRVDPKGFVRAKTAEGWTFSPTENALAFRVDRKDTSVALGSTVEHLLGDFYVQELSASMSVWQLAEGGKGPYRQWDEPFRILDVAASPGGKTTQLAEHFPNAFIVANEFAKERISSLIENVERMGASDRTGVTNMNGVLFGNLPETFDRILLDAPCSGEGIGFKAEESLKFWNLKNVKTIARLQEKLLIASLRALKTGGEMLYSTCTLNRFENEGVLAGAAEALPGVFEIVFQKRFWPHVEEAGGFFVAKIRKVAAAPSSEKELRSGANPDVAKCTDRESDRIRSALSELGTADFDAATHRFYRYKNDILAVRRSPGVDELANSLYFLRMGERIGRLENGEFAPNWILGKNRDLAKVAKCELADEATLHRYLSGFELSSDSGDGLVQIAYKNRFLGLERVRNGKITNSFPKEWRRK
jgi:16S rRNA (cytosine1407-C5)-methyltransferase